MVQTWAVGEPAPIELLDIPGLTWAIDSGPRLVLVVPADDAEVMAAAVDGDLRLGLSQHGPVMMLTMRLQDPRGSVLGYWDAPGYWLTTHTDAPEVLVDGERIMWNLHIVTGAPSRARRSQWPARLPVAGLRAFTTSPAFTRELRRAMAEARAHGPLDRDEAMTFTREHYSRHPSGSSSWRAAIITSRAGA